MASETGPSCVRCAYAVENYHLECRLKPPAPNYKTHGRMFPIMNYNDWCAKYKAKVEPEPEPEPDERFEQMLEDWKEE